MDAMYLRLEEEIALLQAHLTAEIEKREQAERERDESLATLADTRPAVASQPRGRGRWLSAAETEQVREALDGLWEFVVMVPCSDCGLPDPERYARNCVTCDRGAALIAVTRAALAVLAVPASQEQEA